RAGLCAISPRQRESGREAPRNESPNLPPRRVSFRVHPDAQAALARCDRRDARARPEREPGCRPFDSRPIGTDEGRRRRRGEEIHQGVASTIMDYVTIEFDDAGRAESDLARVWIEAQPGERDRITLAEEAAENHLRQDPKAGTLITDGVFPPVRFLDWDIL